MLCFCLGCCGLLILRMDTRACVLYSIVVNDYANITTRVSLASHDQRILASHRDKGSESSPEEVAMYVCCTSGCAWTMSATAQCASEGRHVRTPLNRQPWLASAASVLTNHRPGLFGETGSACTYHTNVRSKLMRNLVRNLARNMEFLISLPLLLAGHVQRKLLYHIPELSTT
jgi:hypothetical protein